MATASGVPPDLAIDSAIALTSRALSALSRSAAASARAGRSSLEKVEDGVDRALADPEPPISTPLIRLCAVNGMNLAPSS